MKKSRFTEQQIAFALRQAEGGASVREVCRKMGISEQTFYRWKKKFAGMGVAEVRRLKQLEDENRRLKQLVADLSLDRQILQDALKEKPPFRFAACSLSEDGVQYTIGIWRERASCVPSTCRTASNASCPKRCRRSGPAPKSDERDRRYTCHLGYPRIWIKLRREGWLVNRKRLYRLYKEEGLCMGKHKPRRHKSCVTRPEQTKATHANESWSMDVYL